MFLGGGGETDGYGARVEGGLSVRGSDANPAAKTGGKKITSSSTSARVTTGNNAVRQYDSRARYIDGLLCVRWWPPRGIVLREEKKEKKNTDRRQHPASAVSLVGRRRLRSSANFKANKAPPIP